MTLNQKIEKSVEYLLWHSRRAMFFAVVACMVAFFTVLFMTVIDLFHVVMPVLKRILSLDFAADASHLHEETLKRVVGLVDSFLVAIFLLLFAYGMYELFVSELDPARKDLKSKSAPAVLGLLPIRSLDDLKSNLVKVITAILIVTLFEHAVAVDVETPIELIYFATAILLVALALYITHLATNLRFGRGEPGPNDGASSGPSDSTGDSSAPASR
jgi:uncharacterized membrane protein YqhA